MAIELKCTCGRVLQLADNLAGRLVRCPVCPQILRVPDDEEITEEIVVGHPPRSVPVQKQPTSVPPPLPKVDSTAADPLDEATNRKPKKRPRRRKRSAYWDQGASGGGGGFAGASDPELWLGNLNAGVLGGAVSLLMGLLLFFILRPFGVISFWSIILIVVGVAAVIKGLLEQ